MTFNLRSNKVLLYAVLLLCIVALLSATVVFASVNTNTPAKAISKYNLLTADTKYINFELDSKADIDYYIESIQDELEASNNDWLVFKHDYTEYAPYYLIKYNEEWDSSVHNERIEGLRIWADETDYNVYVYGEVHDEDFALNELTKDAGSIYFDAPCEYTEKDVISYVNQNDTSTEDTYYIYDYEDGICSYVKYLGDNESYDIDENTLATLVSETESNTVYIFNGEAIPKPPMVTEDTVAIAFFEGHDELDPNGAAQYADVEIGDILDGDIMVFSYSVKGSTGNAKAYYDYITYDFETDWTADSSSDDLETLKEYAKTTNVYVYGTVIESDLLSSFTKDTTAVFFNDPVDISAKDYILQVCPNSTAYNVIYGIDDGNYNYLAVGTGYDDIRERTDTLANLKINANGEDVVFNGTATTLTANELTKNTTSIEFDDTYTADFAIKYAQAVFTSPTDGDRIIYRVGPTSGYSCIYYNEFGDWLEDGTKNRSISTLTGWLDVFNIYALGTIVEALDITTNSTDWTNKGNITTKVGGNAVIAAEEGSEVALEIVPENGYALDSIKIYKTGDTSTVIEPKDSAFTMPGYAITIEAYFYQLTSESDATGTFGPNVTNQINVLAGYIGTSAAELESKLNTWCDEETNASKTIDDLMTSSVQEAKINFALLALYLDAKLGLADTSQLVDDTEPYLFTCNIVGDSSSDGMMYLVEEFIEVSANADNNKNTKLIDVLDALIVAINDEVKDSFVNDGDDACYMLAPVYSYLNTAKTNASTTVEQSEIDRLFTTLYNVYKQGEPDLSFDSFKAIAISYLLDVNTSSNKNGMGAIGIYIYQNKDELGLPATLADIEWSTLAENHYQALKEYTFLMYVMPFIKEVTMPSFESSTLLLKESDIWEALCNYYLKNLNDDDIATAVVFGNQEFKLLQIYNKLYQNTGLQSVPSNDYGKAYLDLVIPSFFSLTITDDTTDTNGSVTVSETSAIVGSEVTITAEPDAGYNASISVYKTGDSDATITVSEGKFIVPTYDVTIVVTFVEKDEISICTDAQTYTYDGEEQEFELSGDDAEEDGFTVTYYSDSTCQTIAESVIDAGTYYVKVTRDEDDTFAEYESSAITLTIEKATYNMDDAEWDYTEAFTYDDTDKTVSVKGLPEGVTVDEYSNNVYKSAGSYTASVTFKYDSDNYNEPTIDDLDWEIEKATYNMDDAEWDYTEAITYDGNKKTVEVKGLPEGVTVDKYTDNEKTVVGTYTASATLAYDTDNYNEISIDDLDWEIVKADYDFSNSKWNYTSAIIYDGTEKTVSIDNLPEGLTPDYEGETGTNVGSYTASVTFTYDTANYNEPSFDNLNWAIGKNEYDMSNVKWNYNGAFDYDGTEKTVAVIGLPDGVTIKSYTNANAIKSGKYTAKVTLDYDRANYKSISVDDLAWEIKSLQLNSKATNGLIEVYVVAPGKGFPSTVKLNANKEYKADYDLDYSSIIGSREAVAFVYDIELVKVQNNKETTAKVSDYISGSVKVRIHIPDDVDVSNLSKIIIAHSEDDIETITFDQSMVDGDRFVELEVDRFSEFAFIYKTSSIGTGAIVGIVVGSVALVAIIIALVFVGFFKMPALDLGKKKEEVTEETNRVKKSIKTGRKSEKRK